MMRPDDCPTDTAVRHIATGADGRTVSAPTTFTADGWADAGPWARVMFSDGFSCWCPLSMLRADT